MGVRWTDEQKKVIELRDRNILVSAAAGSGKTAVLVERIINMVTDKAAPMDIDQLLVVTFTKAAAGEMRERIRLALEKKLEETPENVHLQKQVTLIHEAQITTIHSFCLHVIQNYFHTIDLDPGFRVADEGELKLLKSDIVQEILEENYDQGKESFLHFIECYSTGKTDAVIEELILQLYNFSMSYPWPQEWLDTCQGAYQVQSFDELEGTAWMEKVCGHIAAVAEALCSETEDALAMAMSDDGPYMYEEALLADKKMLEHICSQTDYTGYSSAFADISFVKLSVKRDKNVSAVKRETVKNMRNQVKKSLNDLKEQYFYQDPERMLEDIKNSRAGVQELIRLTQEFIERYRKTKNEKNIVDFNDLEHYALEILTAKTEDGECPTEVAKELSERFKEIMIDEYQDSNFVQETILTSVSKKWKGQNNLFMVGDVKQSIYRFRLARPELFMGKYEGFSTADSEEQRIDLHKNFRSREQVLAGVNFIFEQIMAKSLGNIEYDEDAALRTGADFPETEDKEFNRTEILVVDTSSSKIFDQNIDETEMELEAKAIAGKMKEIIREGKVLDKETQQYRPVRYSDIVVLLRTMARWADTFTRVFQEENIPAYASSQTGYFSTVEIQVVLNLLHIIDNPRQDVPMTSVLMSPIADLNAEDMAKIKSSYPNDPIYTGALLYSQSDIVDGLKEKLASFFNMLDEFRRKVPYTPIHELIWYVLDNTGYHEFILAMPHGEQRRANMDMLVEKAVDYEKTSYKGLFNFIRYIEHLQKYDIDFGEASTIGENDNTVRIMSIHKSKGLEFPIVILGGMGKKFNTQDSRSKVIIHPDLGIGVDYIDPETRIKAPVLIKKAIQKQIILENLGEELRVLYVALTRAKEKLIMVGTMKDIQKKVEKWAPVLEQKNKQLSFSFLSKAANYWDLTLPALLRNKAADSFLDEFEVPAGFKNPVYNSDIPFFIESVSLEDLFFHEYKEIAEQEYSRKRMKEWDSEAVFSPELRSHLETNFQYVYPYQMDKDIITKMTVSELKRRGQLIDEQYSWLPYKEPDIVPLIPSFMQEEKGLTGAQRGSAYHKLLEYINLAEISSAADVRKQIDILVQQQKLTQEMADVIYAPSIFKFAQSDLAKRIQKAMKEKKLYREQQFVIGVNADTIDPEWSKEQSVLIQGIIDLFFCEDEEIVLVDYKTDYLEPGEEQKLADRYKMQMDYYESAIRQMTGKNVKEKIIYSFSLQKEICIKTL